MVERCYLNVSSPSSFGDWFWMPDITARGIANMADDFLWKAHCITARTVR